MRQSGLKVEHRGRSIGNVSLTKIRLLFSYATGYGIGEKSGSHNLRRMKIMEVLHDRTFQGRVPRWLNFLGQGGFWPSVFLQGNSANTH